MRQHKFSVVLTSFNRPVMVCATLDSVFSQSYTGPIQLIIMDDNSNDKTLTAIQKKLAVKGYQSEGILTNEGGYTIQNFNSSLRSNLNILLCISDIEDKNRQRACRYSVLINFALSKANGDIVCYLTDDSVWYENKFSVLNEIFQDSEIQVTYDEMSHYYVAINDEGVVRLNKHHEFNNTEIGKAIPFSRERLEHGNFIDHIALSHRIDCVIPVTNKYESIWDENKNVWLYGDWVFWKRLVEFYSFTPVPILLSEKWKHPKCIQNSCTSVGLFFMPSEERLQE